MYIWLIFFHLFKIIASVLPVYWIIPISRHLLHPCLGKNTFFWPFIPVYWHSNFSVPFVIKLLEGIVSLFFKSSLPITFLKTKNYLFQRERRGRVSKLASFGSVPRWNSSCKFGGVCWTFTDPNSQFWLSYNNTPIALIDCLGDSQDILLWLFPYLLPVVSQSSLMIIFIWVS